MVRLTAAYISSIHDGADIASIPALSVPHRGIDQIVGLDVCERLTRLDLNDNQISSLEGLSMCTKLKWLSVAGNQLTSLKGVENLPKLLVLNASRNELTSINEVAVLSELRALIVNDNKISAVCRLDNLVDLNTLVVSRNPIRNLGKVAAKLLALTKLSATHCQLQILGSSLKHCVGLEELRLSQNGLMSLPKELERNGRLSILDLGTNCFQKWSDLEVLETLHSLVNLTLRGNPICSKDDYLVEVKRRLPKLKILDSHLLENVHKKKRKMVKIKEDVVLENSKQEKTEIKSSEDPFSVATIKKKKIAEGNYGEIEEEGSFLKLIFSSPGEGKIISNFDLSRQLETSSRKKIEDSAVVSILNNQKVGKVSGKNVINKIFSQGLEIGSGGASTWDELPVAAAETASNDQPLLTKQNIATGHKHGQEYSRWKLKSRR